MKCKITLDMTEIAEMLVVALRDRGMTIDDTYEGDAVTWVVDRNTGEIKVEVRTMLVDRAASVSAPRTIETKTVISAPALKNPTRKPLFKPDVKLAPPPDADNAVFGLSTAKVFPPPSEPDDSEFEDMGRQDNDTNE